MIKHFFLSLLVFAFISKLFAQQYGSLKDSRDGRVYKTVKIGEQEWMAENLNTDRFRNGDLIPEAKTASDWIRASEKKTPAWSYYNNDTTYSRKCGKLYNWYAISDPRGLAPLGWRIASAEDWELLIRHLGGRVNDIRYLTQNTVAEQLKSTTGWYKTNGLNSSGFSCYPCGFRSRLVADFNGMGQEAAIWTSSPQGNEIFARNSALGAWLNYEDRYLTNLTIFSKDQGSSVRIIKENSIRNESKTSLNDELFFLDEDEPRKSSKDTLAPLATFDENDGIAPPVDIDQGKQIVEEKIDESIIFEKVEIEASFPGGDIKWRQYLERNANEKVATDNGAPEGTYTVVVQFVVDKEGRISDVRSLTNHGYGMEEEAMRAIKKGPKWNPAIHNGRQVKAYRKQPITFRVRSNKHS